VSTAHYYIVLIAAIADTLHCTVLAVYALPALALAQLMTNNPFKLKCLKAMGIAVSARIPMLVPPNPHSERYLRSKWRRMSHLLALDDEGALMSEMAPPAVAVAAVASSATAVSAAAAATAATVVGVAAGGSSSGSSSGSSGAIKSVRGGAEAGESLLQKKTSTS
jgi:hypothetical protein